MVHCETLAEVKLLVVRPETVRAPPVLVRPLPMRLVNKLLLINREPIPRLPVVVALPMIVVEPTESKPLVKPTVVEVETPYAVGVNGKAAPPELVGVVVAITLPVESTARNVPAGVESEVIARLVVVALTAVRAVIVDDAVESRPPLKVSKVDVAFEGKRYAKLEPPEPQPVHVPVIVRSPVIVPPKSGR